MALVLETMKKIVAILTIALLCCGFIPQHRAVLQKIDNRSATELYSEAIKRLSIHKDTVGATQYLMKVFAKDSTNAEAMHLYSRIAKNNKERIVFAEMAYKLDSTNRFYLEQYTNSLYEADDFDKAYPLCKKLVKKSTNALDFYRLAYIEFAHRKDFDAALKVIDQATQRLGPIAYFQNLRINLLLKSDRADVAEKEALKEIEKAPHIADNYILLADLYQKTKRDSLAMETYKRGFAADSTSVDLLAEYSIFCRRSGHITEYLTALNKLMQSNEVPVKVKIEEWESIAKLTEGYQLFYPLYNQIITSIYSLHPDNKFAKQSYGEHLLVSGKHEEGLKLYKESLKLDNVDWLDYFKVIRIEAGLFERMDSVRVYLDRGLEKFPNTYTFHSFKGDLYMYDNKYDEAIPHYNEAIKHVENDTLRSNLYSKIGDVHHLRKDMKSCYKAYEMALSYNLDNSSVLNNYAYFLSLDGKKLKFALAMAERANKLSENNSTYLDTKAWVLYKLGRYSEAKVVMQKALSLSRNKGYEYPLHYAQILYALGEEFMANTYWRKAIEACTSQEETNEVEKLISKTVKKKKKK